MGIAANNAYEGTSEMDNGTTVRVLYLNAAEVTAHFGKQPKFGIRRKRPGWYWCYVDYGGGPYHGPYTSSRRAAVAAIACNLKVAS